MGVDLLAGYGVDEGEEFRVGGGGGVFGGWGKEELVADCGGERDDLDAVGDAEVFLCYSACCYSSDRLAC